MKQRLCLLLASGFYIGRIPGAPGTYASAATTLVFYLVWRISYHIAPELHMSVLCLVTVLGVFTAAEVSRQSGIKDPQYIVIDEIAGQLLALLFLPVTLLNLLAGTVLFRVFDIWKPLFIRRLEPLGNGVGIMADDLLAGLYANACLHLIDWAVKR